MRESVIEKYLVKRVKERGGEVRKVKWLDRRGAPDRLVLFCTGDLHLVELKATGKKLEPHQGREHRRLQRLGVQVWVLDSIEAVDRFLR